MVRKLLTDAAWFGAGKRYLIQHSAGSGKSNSIAWLAHQLIALRKDGAEVFDSIIVITDRRLLDKQIRETIKGFTQVKTIIGALKDGNNQSKTQQLSGYLKQGKKIIITTVQTFPFVLDSIGEEHRGKKFAIIIDEAHSSQGGRTAAAMSMALAEGGAVEEEDTTEDKINRIIESRKLLSNASYFAFTATPKNKTLELFGIPYRVGDEVKHRPFHSYTMKQAIQEGFILDVLKQYTPVDSYYRLAKTIDSDPEFDVKRARKKLRRYVESHDKAIRDKAEIMVDHFLEQVIGQNKIGGQARAMVLPDTNAEIEPVPTSGGGRKNEPELDRLSNIIKSFNDQFGGLFSDAKRMEKRIMVFQTASRPKNHNSFSGNFSVNLSGNLHPLSMRCIGMLQA